MRLLLACACLWLAACTPSTSTSLADRLVAPGGASPLIDAARIDAALATLPHRSGEVTVSAGIPIFWRAFEPGDYGMQYRYAEAQRAAGPSEAMALQLRPPHRFAPLAPRGTVVLLHGWMMNGDAMLPWSLQLAQSGFRVISLDLRGHGRSGQAPAGYGTYESDDVVEVIAALRRRGEVEGPLYLFGISYGAATALFTAQKLGPQVAGVVAMESFANAGSAIRSMVPHMLSLRPTRWQEQALAGYARWLYGSQDLDRVIAAADRRLGLHLDAVDVAAAVADSPACVLAIHGDADEHVPVDQGRQLALASARTHYIEMRGEDHVSLPMRLDLLGSVVEDWLLQGHGPLGTCPPPRMPVQANLMALHHPQPGGSAGGAAGQP